MEVGGGVDGGRVEGGGTGRMSECGSNGRWASCIRGRRGTGGARCADLRLSGAWERCLMDCHHARAVDVTSLFSRVGIRSNETTWGQGSQSEATRGWIRTLSQEYRPKVISG